MTSASADPAAVARSFLDAVAWAEHTHLWDLLSAPARLAVLDVATRRGMDALRSARLREGTAADAERDEFLADLLHGVRADLGDIDLDAVRCVAEPEEPAGAVVVRLDADVPAALGAPVPVGTVELVSEPHLGWRVARVRSW